MPPLSRDEERAAQTLIELALEEDLGSAGDVTSNALIPESATGTVLLVARREGVVSGLPVMGLVFRRLDPRVEITERVQDGSRVAAGTVAAELNGPVRSLLSGERTALNFLMLLSGVATLTRQFVDAVAGTRAAILDTRKTVPGYRLLQKYAVRCGGGMNHRMGLFDAILIKDNHLAAWREGGGNIAEAIRFTRENSPAGTCVEVEVDSLEQLEQVLPATPEIVLLDNMPPATMRQAVALRDRSAPAVLLEASGGVTLANVRAIAETGVDRISIGGLTHSAPALDLGFDWRQGETR